MKKEKQTAKTVLILNDVLSKIEKERLLIKPVPPTMHAYLKYIVEKNYV